MRACWTLFGVYFVPDACVTSAFDPVAVIARAARERTQRIIRDERFGHIRAGALYGVGPAPST